MVGHSNSLIGAGIAPQAAAILGDSFANVTLTGTSQVTAAPLYMSVSIVTASASNTGGILPAHNQGRNVKVVNTSSTNAVVYPPVGGQINGLSANTGVTVSANKSAEFQCISVSNTGVASYSAVVSA